MRRQSNRLTVTQVKAALRRAPEQGRVLLNDGNNLNVQIQNRVPSWILRYQINGVRHSMGLGPIDPRNIDLGEARERAEDNRRLLRRGVDPLMHRRSERQTQQINNAVPSFAECAQRYIDAHRVEWKNGRQAHEWQRSLEADVFPVIGRLPVAAIDVGLVLRCLEPIWETKNTTASRERQRIENILDWARSKGYRSGDNPARWAGNLQYQLAKPSKVHTKQHHPALPHNEIGSFMARLREQDGVAAAALEFAILTCARSDETLGAPWKEFNLDERLWTVPPERMKGQKEHQVPLSPPAMAILKRMRAMRDGDDPADDNDGGFVFPGNTAGKPLGHQSMRRVLTGLNSKVSVHGFRSTFRDWAAEETDFEDKICEMAIAHTVGTETKRAYERTALVKKRRQLAEAWARYCGTIAEPREQESDRQIAA